MTTPFGRECLSSTTDGEAGSIQAMTLAIQKWAAASPIV
jgi:hypothetical protein